MLKCVLPLSAIGLCILMMNTAKGQPEPVKSGSTVITSIDIKDLLTNSLGLNRARRVAEDSACPGGGGGGGMRAKRWCYWDIEFRDLTVEKLISIDVGDVELSKIPTFYKFEHVGFENCWANRAYPFDEEVKYKSSQSATVALSEILTNVSEYSNTIDVNAKLLNYVGIQQNTKIGTSVKYELTKSSTISLQDDFELSQRIKYDIPPMTASWAYYADEKRDVKVPVTIKGVIGGRVVDHSSYGTDSELFRLADRPEAARTFTVHGYIEFVGSNRSLDVKTGDKQLSAVDCAQAVPPPH
jgi:hypothetical protein